MGLFGDLYEEAASEEFCEDELCSSSYSILAASGERYSLDKEIGAGGSKKIHLVFDSRLRREVAMAIPRDTSDKAQYDAFIHEAWITGQLDHPGIIKVHDAGLDADGVPFFTMDVKRGVNLGSILKDYYDCNTVDYSLDKLINTYMRICDAVAYAHSRHILHLDLKPDNVQIGEYGEVVICDWGLAKIVNWEEFESINRLDLNADILESESRNEYIKGTPGYMSPEQVRGEEETTASDIYALGALLYVILAGQSHIGRLSDIRKAMEQTISGDIIPPSSCVNQLHKVPKGLEAVAMKALANDPQGRYHSVVELRDDINKFLNGYVTSAETQSIFKEALFFYRRNKLISTVSLVSVLFIVTGTIAFMFKLNQSWREEFIARQRAEIAQERAEAARERADEALSLYQQEKKSGGVVRQELSQELVHKYQIFNSPEFIKQPVVMLEKSLRGFQYIRRTNPDHPQADMMIGLILFISQYYDRAAVAIPSNKQLEHLKDVAAKLPEFEPTENNPVVPVSVFSRVVELIRQTGDGRHAFGFRSIVYDCAQRKDMNGYESVVEQALHVFNSMWEQSDARFEYSDKKLRLSGWGLRDLQLKDHFGVFHILKTIPIDYLDVRYTSFEDLSHLAETSLITLDIRRTKVKDLSPLSKLTTLKTLIVEPGQFSEEQLATVPSTISVRLQK